jgi:hypothetical protein
MEIIQNELSLKVKSYMDEKKLNPTQLSKELGVTKAVIVQVLKGKFNYSLSKLIELSLSIGVVPHLEFTSLTDYRFKQEIKQPKRKINIAISASLPVKGGKTKSPLNRNENGIAVSMDVHQASTITPSDTKIA